MAPITDARLAGDDIGDIVRLDGREQGRTETLRAILMTEPRVFIGYSHDSEPHREAVLQLAQRLRERGIDVRLDRFTTAPEEGWTQWMVTQLDAADFVIIVCSETYRRRFEGQEAPGEGLLAIQPIYDDHRSNTKFVPVIFAATPETDIPLALRPYARYTLPGQFDGLYRHLTGQPGVVAAPLGAPPNEAMMTAIAAPKSSPPHSGIAFAPAMVRSESGLDVPIEPSELLFRLLLTLFSSSDQFRQWIKFGPEGHTLVAEIPGGAAPISATISGGLDVLGRRGHLDAHFFARLISEFPRRQDDIARIAAAWGAGPSWSSPSSAATISKNVAPAAHGGSHIDAVGDRPMQADRDGGADDEHATGEAAPSLAAVRRFPSTAEGAAAPLPPGTAPIALQRAGLGYQARWHIERKEEEEWALESLLNSGDPVAVCAPMHFGKSWFMERVLSVAQQRAPHERIARVNFDVVESTELELLLQSIAEQIGRSVDIDIAWPHRGTPQGRLLEVLDSQIRPKVPQNMILALDLPHDLMRFRERDALARTMRALSGQGDRHRFPWLRMIVALSTAPALLGDLMGSPWSVPEIQLDAFSDAQILALAGHHSLIWGDQELELLHRSIGGHPYMLRGALYEAARLGVALDRAIDNDAVRSHIRRLEAMLVHDKDLLGTLGAVVDGRPVHASYAHRLEAAGIISFTRESLRYKLRFPIYQKIAERLAWR